jgi:hypothetical protein
MVWRENMCNAHKVKVCGCYLVFFSPSNRYDFDLVCVVRHGSKNKHHKGRFTWGFKSQVPLILASPHVEAKSQFLSLEKALEHGQFSLKSDLDYFMRKYLWDLCWELAKFFFARPTFNTNPKPTSKKCDHVGIYVILGAPCEVVSPNCHALNN